MVEVEGFAPNEDELSQSAPPGEETVWIEWQVFDLDDVANFVYDGNTTLSAPGTSTNDELAGSVLSQRHSMSADA